jgi:TolB-like protein
MLSQLFPRSGDACHTRDVRDAAGRCWPSAATNPRASQPVRVPPARRAPAGLSAPSAWLLLSACRAPGSSAPQPVIDAATTEAVARERALDPAGLGALGVPPFAFSGSDPRLTALGFAMADLLITDLSRSRQLQLVERARLGEILQELDLAGAGRVDSLSAPRVGRLLQARRLVLGSVDTLPTGEYRLTVRVANVETGVLEQALDARASAGDLLAAEKVIAYRLFDALGITLSPAERAAVDDLRPAASLAALVAYGEGVEAELTGDRKRAFNAYSSAALLAPTFAVPRQRAAALRPVADNSGNMPSLLPGVRPINAPVSGTVDRLNRPLDLFTSYTRPSGGAGDPAFPSTIVTIVIQVRRPQ